MHLCSYLVQKELMNKIVSGIDFEVMVNSEYGTQILCWCHLKSYFNEQAVNWYQSLTLLKAMILV